MDFTMDHRALAGKGGMSSELRHDFATKIGLEGGALRRLTQFVRFEHEESERVR